MDMGSIEIYIGEQVNLYWRVGQLTANMTNPVNRHHTKVGAECRLWLEQDELKIDGIHLFMSNIQHSTRRLKLDLFIEVKGVREHKECETDITHVILSLLSSLSNVILHFFFQDQWHHSQYS